MHFCFIDQHRQPNRLGKSDAKALDQVNNLNSTFAQDIAKVHKSANRWAELNIEHDVSVQRLGLDVDKHFLWPLSCGVALYYLKSNALELSQASRTLEDAFR